MPSRPANPVSYTHLDVYKRQDLWWGQTGATERGAQPGQRRSRLSRPAVAPTSVASPAVNAAGWVLGRAGVETDVAGETVATGAYWAPHTWQMARAAYVYDLDTDPGCPDAFLGWLHRAIEDHVDRGPQGRAELEIPAPEGRDGGRGFNRHHPLAAETRAALEAVSYTHLDVYKRQV